MQGSVTSCVGEFNASMQDKDFDRSLVANIECGTMDMGWEVHFGSVGVHGGSVGMHRCMRRDGLSAACNVVYNWI